MLRFLAYFATIFVVWQVLAHAPLVGWIFRIPLLGFFATAALVGAVGRYWAEGALARRRMQALKRQLGGVETPHNLGKLGSFLESDRQWRAAIPHLEQATLGEPESAEWHWRLGHCLLESGEFARAAEELRAAAAIDEEHAYGSVLMMLSEAQRKMGDLDLALSTLERFERNHGPNPESAYRRGRVLAQLGRKEEASQAYGSVSELARSAARYQRKTFRGYALKAFLARTFG